MSYFDATIGKLSPAQISKLLNGHAARIKGGSVHKVKLSQEQAKKLHKAQMCGKAVQVRFDPYQIQMHRQMKGKGLFDDIGNAFKPMGSPQFWERAGKKAAGAAIDYAVPAAAGAAAGFATSNPFAAPVASYGTSQLIVPEIHKAIGFGLKKKRGRPRKTKGGTVKQDLENFYNDKIPMEFHPGLESLGNAGIKMLGFGKRGRPRKTKGGTVKQDLENFYNDKIPMEFHPGLESLGNAGIKMLGFGKRGRKPIKGSALFAAGY